MTENSTALLFDILDTATQGDPDSAANNIALLNQLLTATDNDPSNISANEIALLTEILSIITDQPPDVAANEIAVLTEILSAIQTQNPQVRANKIALLNEIAANSQSLIDALNPVTLPVAASDLVAWYPFRAGTGEDITAGDSRFGDTTDYSATVNGATFQASGGVTDIQTGANSGAFEFDGTDDELSNARGLDGTSVTILAQINTNTNLGDFGRVYSTNGTNSAGGIDMNARDTDDRLQVGITDSAGFDTTFTPFTQPTNGFVQLGFRYDGQTLDLIKNGAVVSSVQTQKTIPQNPAKIGVRPGGIQESRFGGVIDSLRVYDAPLSNSQIATYNQNTSP
jgi:hypothetical protein